MVDTRILALAANNIRYICGISNINTFADLNKLTSPQLQQEKSGIANELLRLRGEQRSEDGWLPPPLMRWFLKLLNIGVIIKRGRHT